MEWEDELKKFETSDKDGCSAVYIEDAIAFIKSILKKQEDSWQHGVKVTKELMIATESRIKKTRTKEDESFYKGKLRGLSTAIRTIELNKEMFPKLPTGGNND